MVSVTSRLPRLRRGMRLGKYQLFTRLADGGFSRVWKARDTLENRWVALKIPDPIQHGSEDEVDLLEEIRLSARLDHPNILRLRNADKVGEHYLIASDLADECLEDRLARRLSVRKAFGYIDQILDGLAFAHKNRVIHRDLKPANLLLFPGDQLRIADFGLAKVTHHSMISATGSGSLLYIAPEQAHGYPCFASDIFSVGLILHQMLTGHLPRWPFEWPFEGVEILQSKVPEEFVRLVRKATHFDRGHRYPDAVAMRAAFESLRPAIRRFIEPRTRRRRRRRTKLGNWRKIRYREFSREFARRLSLRFDCPDCDGPISEHMSNCPWCGLKEIDFGEGSDFDHYCARCRRGLRDEWRYCPWCWGPGFPEADGKVRSDPRYGEECKACDGPLIPGMSYCPWCHAKRTRPVAIDGLPDACPRCRSSIANDFWEFCAWCGVSLRTGSSRRKTTRG